MTARDTDHRGAALTIDVDAHDRFIALSGDRSPLHADAAHARRTAFGGPVVHGVHLVLRVLEAALRDVAGPVALEHLDAEFRSHVGVGMPVTVEVADGVGTVVRGGRVAARARWRFGPADPEAHRVTPADGAEASPPVAPAPDDVTDLLGARHREPLRLDAALLAGLLPAVAARLEPADVAGLLATTRLVGMRWPGERALLRRVQVARGDGGPAGSTAAAGDLTAEVVAAHRGTGLVRCEVRHGRTVITAEAQARPPVVRQPPLAEVRAQVPAGRFAGVRVWVVGGGRGIGEVAAKLLAAGGATVLVSGRDEADASRVAHEVGGDAAAFDVTIEPDPELVARIRAAAPTHLAYFAAPSLLPLGPDDAHGRSVLDTVLRAGLRTCLEIAGGPSALHGVFVPSSVLVSEPTPGFEAYAATKAAVEADLSALSAAHPDLALATPRLPQLLSDQTAGVAGLAVGGTVAALLPELARWIPEPRG